MLTPRMIKGISAAVGETLIPLKHIAMTSGITYQTLRNWLRNGEEYKQQIEDGKITKGDLTTKQKREVELFEKVGTERSGKVKGYLDAIHKLADKQEDIRAYQWLLKIEDPIFRDVDGEVVEADTIKNSNEVVVVNIAGGVETSQLLSEFLDGSKNLNVSASGGKASQLIKEFKDGSAKDGEEKEGHREDSEDSHR